MTDADTGTLTLIQEKGDSRGQPGRVSLTADAAEIAGDSAEPTRARAAGSQRAKATSTSGIPPAESAFPHLPVCQGLIMVLERKSSSF